MSEDVERKQRELWEKAARGLNFVNFKSENFGKITEQKIIIKPEFKNVFLKEGFTDEEAVRFSKLAHLYFCSLTCYLIPPLTDEKILETKKIVKDFINITNDHELPVLLLSKFLFDLLDDFADRFFDVDHNVEDKKINFGGI